MAEHPYMPLWTDAYLGDTTHLSTIEHGAYLLLLMAMWRADGSLPNDDKLLARYAKLTKGQWTKLKPTLMVFFQVENDRITQGRLTDELNAVRQKSKSQSAKAKARWLKNKETGDANASPRHSRGNATIATTTVDDDDDTRARARNQAGTAEVSKPHPELKAGPPQGSDPSPSTTAGPPEVSEPPSSAPPGPPGVSKPPPGTDAEKRALQDRITDLRDKVLIAANIDTSKDTSGRWLGSQSRYVVQRWIELGLTDEEILEEIRAVMVRRGGDPPETLNYFDKPMAKLAGRKQAAPLTPTPPNNGGTNGSGPSRPRTGHSPARQRVEDDAARDAEIARLFARSVE